MQRKETAYLTVYLSLVFGIVLSLFLALIEGAAIGAARTQAELAADLGLDSVFAEYHREILDQYELFFIDSSYGSTSGGIGMTEKHLSDYLAKNMDPDKGIDVYGATTYLKLTNPYLEIREVSYASDNYGAVWKAQAVAYMKAVYGGDIINTVKDHIETVKKNEMDTRDVASELKKQKEEFEKALEEKEIIELDTETSDGNSYTKVSKLVDKLISGTFLKLVIPSSEKLSQASVRTNDYYSGRVRAGKVNSGVGLHEGAFGAGGLADELIYGEYLMKVCGNYRNQKEDSVLKYQIEYILYGLSSDASNLSACLATLFAVRSAGNLIAIYSNSGMKAQAEAVAEILCCLIACPELTPVLKNILLGVWALAESVADMKNLLDGGKVPLIKKEGQWSLSLSGVLSGNFFGSGKKEEGLSYQAYLRVLLGLMNQQKKVARSLDIVEMDIRETEGNRYFRIDQCIDYMKVNFGFADAAGHDFVFEKMMCYE
ncbi:MAG: hypothetical protein K2P35_01335 [Lachnospiraceae bacterium]|nr:hypothetical protein [Lachnospiraceae bacterium]